MRELHFTIYIKQVSLDGYLVINKFWKRKRILELGSGYTCLNFMEKLGYDLKTFVTHKNESSIHFNSAFYYMPIVRF